MVKSLIIQIGGGQLSEGMFDEINNKMYQGQYDAWVLMSSAFNKNKVEDKEILYFPDFIFISHEHGEDVLYLKERFVELHKKYPNLENIRVIYTKGTSALKKGQDYFNVIYNPAIATITALCETFPSTITKTLVMASSSAVSIPGMTQRSKYAEVRGKTDEKVLALCEKYQIRGAIARLDLVFNKLKPHSRNTNHGCSYANMSRMILHPFFGNEEQGRTILAIQPISIEHWTAFALSQRVGFDAKMSIVNAVGNKTYTSYEAYLLELRPRNKKLRPLYLPLSLTRTLMPYLWRTPGISQSILGGEFLDVRSRNPQANQALDFEDFYKYFDSLRTVEEYKSQEMDPIAAPSPLKNLLTAVVLAFFHHPLPIVSVIPGILIQVLKQLPQLILGKSSSKE